MSSGKITIKNAAEQLNVSVVSIHNWIKEGILKTTDNHITQDSLEEFKRDFLNNNKLSARANKQYKESHNHKSLTEEIKKDLKSSMSGDELSAKYESSLSDSYKNKEGIYYICDRYGQISRKKYANYCRNVGYANADTKTNLKYGNVS